MRAFISLWYCKPLGSSLDPCSIRCTRQTHTSRPQTEKELGYYLCCIGTHGRIAHLWIYPAKNLPKRGNSGRNKHQSPFLLVLFPIHCRNNGSRLESLDILVARLAKSLDGLFIGPGENSTQFRCPFCRQVMGSRAPT